MAENGEDAKDVDIEHGADFGVGDFFDGADDAIAGVLDEDVNAAEGGDGGGDGGFDLRFAGDIAGESKDVVAVLGDEVAEGFGLAGGGDDAVAALEKLFGEDASEAFGGSGDKPDFGHEWSLEAATGIDLVGARSVLVGSRRVVVGGVESVVEGALGFVNGALELGDAFAEAPHEGREALSAEEEEGDGRDDHPFTALGETNCKREGEIQHGQSLSLLCFSLGGVGVDADAAG